MVSNEMRGLFSGIARTFATVSRRAIRSRFQYFSSWGMSSSGGNPFKMDATHPRMANSGASYPFGGKQASSPVGTGITLRSTTAVPA